MTRSVWTTAEKAGVAQVAGAMMRLGEVGMTVRPWRLTTRLGKRGRQWVRLAWHVDNENNSEATKG
jgi:hypothetical protein